jgi:hypothetical protein
VEGLCGTDLNTSALPKRQNLIYRVFRNKAQISTAGLDFGCFGLEFVAREVEVYLLGAEFEGVAVLREEVMPRQ